MTAGPLFVDRAMLFTDIEGSTQRWDGDPDSMRVLLQHHDRLVRDVVAARHGDVVHGTGDGMVAAFSSVGDAVGAALDFQVALAQGPSAAGLLVEPLRVRMGVHCGVVESRGGDLFGPVMHRCARIMSAGHGGQILISSAAAEELRRSSPVEVALVDRGVHRLKGFLEPEAIVEVMRPGTVASRVELRTENAVEGWLPAIDADAFIGREAELAELDDRLTPGCLVTLVGTGGVGKTRLAVHAAHEARHLFPDGTWFVDLARVAEPERVLSALADVLELADDSAESLTASVRRALGERRALFVLDNCEHVLDGVNAMLRAVRSGTSSAALLCTSQRDLGLPGEHVLYVAPLSFEGDVRESPAARLFVERASNANPGFMADEETMVHVATICERVDGLPLAVELAAARVRVMDVATIAERLADTFELLRSRHAGHRHDTLDSTIAWSIDLLTDADREALIDLSVFHAAFDWRAAAAVSGRAELDVADTLDELVRRSLIVRVGGGFRLLAPMRRYCSSTLQQAGRASGADARHARWMQHSVPVPLDDVDPAVVAARMNRLAENIDDLYAAHTWLLDHDPPAAARLALELVDFWLVRSRSNDAMSRLGACDVDGVPDHIRVEVLGWYAGFGWTVGRNEEGEQAAHRALDLAAQAALPLPTFAATRLAVRLAFSNHTAEALELAAATERELLAGNGDPVRLLGPLAVVVAVGGDIPHALELADRAIAEARAVGVVRLQSAIINRLLIAPADPVSDRLRAEAADLARATDRTNVLAHTILAAAHRSLQAGDGRAFLRGVAEFCDIQVQHEPTGALGALQLVPDVAISANARGAAVLLGALEALAEAHDHLGTDLEQQRRADATAKLRRVLGDVELSRAITEGQQLSLNEAIDLLHWLCEPDLPAGVPARRS